jgi:DNA topoisomerase-1
MSKTLFLIEAPGKLKKLKQILGADYIVKASGGHICELARDGADSLGFEMNGNRVNCRFVPRDARAKKTIEELKGLVKGVDRVILATDEDREGEAIAWHLKEVLKLKDPLRVTYREITPAAVRAALQNPRRLNSDLVNAALARAVLDKLVGFKGSPLVWKLNNGAKSIGRVQSAALHILCQREREIGAFKPRDYWQVSVTYTEGFKAYYLGRNAPVGNAAEETEERDDASEAEEKKVEATRVSSAAEAEELVKVARSNPHRVASVEGKTVSKNPPAPFTTATLQQAAGSRLKWSPEKTMQVAQRLYEAGHITYMRTDSVHLDPGFCQKVKDWLVEKDPNNVPDRVVSHRRGKAAQEAHEAIRPTDIRRSSAELKTEIAPEEFELYLLIWLRTVASQCKPARIVKTRIVTRSGDVFWLSRGQTIAFAGYAKYWKDLEADSVLPTVNEGQPLNLKEANHEKKQTQPPPRYTEAKLVQVMERRGIGRPSTFAPTVKTLKERNYAEVVKRQLQATTLGLEVDAFLEKTLPELLEADFTAEMEGRLDSIAAGKENWESYLVAWNRNYFAPALSKAIGALPDAPGEEITDVPCPKCGKPLHKRASSSAKLAVPYFLKCAAPGCDGVMFMDKRSGNWVAPAACGGSVREKVTSNRLCPSCRQPLDVRKYTKDGQEKEMLVCSGKKCKDVAFFKTNQGKWWNKKYGEI